MFISTWTTAGLLMAFVVLSVHTNDIEKRWDPIVSEGIEVILNRGHNSSEMSCDAPDKPLNGGYVSETNVGGHRYNTGDKIQYYCNRGHQLIGQTNRTCNGTSKGWEPEEPYCEPEYIGHLMRRLNAIDDQMRAIEQRITTMENNTIQIGHNISGIGNDVKAVDSKVSAIDNNVSAIFNMSITDLFNWKISRNRERLLVCTDITKAIDEDTVSKCLTMQLGWRNERVSVYEWVIKDFDSQIPQSGSVAHYSPPFYHTVPGYKMRLRGDINSDSEMQIYLSLLPGEYDDQLKWPFGAHYKIIVMNSDDAEFPERYFYSQQSSCYLSQPTTATELNCEGDYSYVFISNNHTSRDGSAVIKLYMYVGYN